MTLSAAGDLGGEAVSQADRRCTCRPVVAPMSDEVARTSSAFDSVQSVQGKCCHIGHISTMIRALSWHYSCLLYTSDAADEEDSVDLGGRRIIKKKKREKKD
eukprot:TRINITY_DN58079_c0_g1_i1.p1 TRINITY_DN58079_c0_g1~~TRINITY_DN58079_c0_g1_i1.p1  ORF type:complete len:102 (+),score=6.84 TRINITY_DN58079_c0_g1_i1:179-484(+)